MSHDAKSGHATLPWKPMASMLDEQNEAEPQEIRAKSVDYDMKTTRSQSSNGEAKQSHNLELKQYRHSDARHTQAPPDTYLRPFGQPTRTTSPRAGGRARHVKKQRTQTPSPSPTPSAQAAAPVVVLTADAGTRFTSMCVQAMCVDIKPAPREKLDT